MPVSTRSRANLRDDEQDLRAQTSHEGSPQRVLPTIRIGALSDRNVPRSDSDIGDVPIRRLEFWICSTPNASTTTHGCVRA